MNAFKPRASLRHRTALLCAAAFGLAAPAGLMAAAQDAGQETGIVEPNTLQLPANAQPRVPVDADPVQRRATARVNGSIITETDVRHRMALTLAAAQGPVTPEQVQLLYTQTLNELIDELIQISAASSEEIAPDKKEIEETYLRVAAQNFQRTPEQMDVYLRELGSSRNSLMRQIEANLAFDNLKRRHIIPFVNVSQEEVAEIIARMEAARGTAEYRIAEIQLNADAANEQAVFQNTQRIVDQIRASGDPNSFARFARQFSEASSAARGGDLGWVRLASLQSPELEAVITQLSPGMIYGPIKVGSGYSIVYLVDQRQILTADPRDATLDLTQILLTFPEGQSQEEMNRRYAAFAQGTAAIRGCGEAEQVAAQTGAEVRNTAGIVARNLPVQLAEEVLKMQVGQVTEPFGSAEEGISVLVLCGRDAPEVAEVPDADALLLELEQERVDKRAQRFMRDLRRDAIIDLDETRMGG